MINFYFRTTKNEANAEEIGHKSGALINKTMDDVVINHIVFHCF